MLVKFRQGIVKYQYVPRFLQYTDTGIHLHADESPAIFSLSHSDREYLLAENQTILNAWPGPFGEDSCWLYVDINLQTAVRTFGLTEVEPSFGTSFPVSPVNDQHFFRVDEMKMYVWNLYGWHEVVRLFLGKLLHLSNGTKQVQIKTTGSQVDVIGNYRAGKILLDGKGSPVKRFNDNGHFEFLTDEDVSLPKATNYINLNPGAADLSVEAYENIPKGYAVVFTADRQIMKASNTLLGKNAVGIVTKDVVAGEKAQIFSDGFFTNKAWFWSAPENSPVFVSSTGELTTTIPETDSFQKIGYVVSYNTLYISPEIQILINPGI
jgi:hypothetical protein